MYRDDNLLAYVYFDVDKAQIYDTCKNDISPLTNTVRQIIKDLENGSMS
jgi:uncharacterized protein with HEPN domain